MKKTAYLLASALLGLLIFIACSKDQRTVNRLEGTWKVTALSENGVAQPDSTYDNTTFTFEKCKVKKGACPGTLTEEGKAIPFTYDISEKGTKMTVTLFGISETSDILENSKTKFRWRTTDGADVTETTIEKQ